ncbi:MAG TPA: hypothetical protein VFD58_19125 [Blastocatellia bacterium]|nr:hypothetical protein [Blastocatellia bacterium]
MNYKGHYACFDCRKAFKERNGFGGEEYKQKYGEHRKVLCPECHRPMADLGLDFKAPKKMDVKQWQKVEILYNHGFTYHSCGCCGPGLRPAELRDVEAFLHDKLPESDGEKLLKKIERAASNRKQ